MLVTELWSDFTEDGIEVDLHDPDRISIIKDAAWFPYIQKAHRDAATELHAFSIDVRGNEQPIDWELFERAPMLTTLSEAGLTPTQYAERAFLVQRLYELHGANQTAVQLATLQLKQRFPLPSNLIMPKDPKIVAAEFRAKMDKKRARSEAQKAELHRAFELDAVANEIFFEGHSTKGSGKSTLEIFPNGKFRSDRTMSGRVERKVKRRALIRRTGI